MAAANDKIADEGLRELASKQPPDVTTVIIEVDVPRARVNVEPRRGLRPHLVGFEPESDEDTVRADEAVSGVRALLDDIASEPPVWLGASSAFVATLRARDLLAVAGSPFVRAIHPNTLRR